MMKPIKAPCKRNLMISRPSNYPSLTHRRTSALVITFSLIVIVSLSSCARKPWRDPLNDTEKFAVLKTLNKIRDNEALRSNCIDADLNIFFTSHLKNRAISGYVQIMQPSFLKFIVSNPFGQPLFAFTTDGSGFNQIDTTHQQFMDGDLEAIGRIYDTPPFVYNRPWGKWLTARLPDSDLITAIREDAEGRGSWVTIINQDETGTSDGTESPAQHLLLDTDNTRILRRIFTTGKGDIEAELSYSDWTPENAWQPGKITIEGLDYGSRIVIEFSAISDMEYCTTGDFQLRQPAGYVHTPIWRQL